MKNQIAFFVVFLLLALVSRSLALRLKYKWAPCKECGDWRSKTVSGEIDGQYNSVANTIRRCHNRHFYKV